LMLQPAAEDNNIDGAFGLSLNTFTHIRVRPLLAQESLIVGPPRESPWRFSVPALAADVREAPGEERFEAASFAIDADKVRVGVHVDLAKTCP
jgi:hypothetical protein